MNTEKLCIGIQCTCTLFCRECKKNTFIPTDSSLTPSNLTSALDSLPDEMWEKFGSNLNVPQSTLDKIKSQFRTDGERKDALLSVYVTEHPRPTWEHVSDVLYRMDDEKCHRTLDIVQSKYPTGESLPPSILPPLSILIYHTPMYIYMYVSFQFPTISTG